MNNPIDNRLLLSTNNDLLKSDIAKIDAIKSTFDADSFVDKVESLNLVILSKIAEFDILHLSCTTGQTSTFTVLYQSEESYDEFLKELASFENTTLDHISLTEDGELTFSDGLESEVIDLFSLNLRKPKKALQILRKIQNELHFYFYDEYDRFYDENGDEWDEDVIESICEKLDQ